MKTFYFVALISATVAVTFAALDPSIKASAGKVAINNDTSKIPVRISKPADSNTAKVVNQKVTPPKSPVIDIVKGSIRNDNEVGSDVEGDDDEIEDDSSSDGEEDDDEEIDEESEESAEPEDSAEPEESAEPEDSAEPKESDEPAESDEPEEDADDTEDDMPGSSRMGLTENVFPCDQRKNGEYIKVDSGASEFVCTMEDGEIKLVDASAKEDTGDLDPAAGEEDNDDAADAENGSTKENDGEGEENEEDISEADEEEEESEDESAEESDKEDLSEGGFAKEDDSDDGDGTVETDGPGARR